MTHKRSSTSPESVLHDQMGEEAETAQMRKDILLVYVYCIFIESSTQNAAHLLFYLLIALTAS